MPILSSDITLSGERYRLARQQMIQRAGLTGRAWQEKHVPVATKREARSNVRPGDVPGEYIITYDDWSKGITGDHEPIPGMYHYGYAVDATTPGAIRPTGRQTTFTNAGTDFEAPCCKVLEFNGLTFLVMGRYVLTGSGITTATDKDFGAGIAATDAIVFNNELVVGFGVSTNKIQSRTAAGVWTAATDAVYSKYFGPVQNRLWGNRSTAGVSNIAPTDNPRTLANWSAEIPVGDNSVPITALNGLGERLVVSKEDGLYLGDAAAIFPNVLPDIASIRDADNGKSTLVIGSQVYYPYRGGGLKQYEPGSSVEVGIGESLTSVEWADIAPGVEISALASQGRFIWAATAPSYFPRNDMTGFLKTIDNEGTYTDYTSDVNSYSTSYADLSSLSTAVNGDYFYVGYTAPYHGVHLTILTPNGTVSVLGADFSIAAGWTAMPVSGNKRIHDLTSVGGATLARSGAILWEADNLTAWASRAINGITAYWVRFNVSVALDADTTVMECRAITNPLTAYVYRGRPRQATDVTMKPVVWDCVYGTAVDRPITALGAFGPNVFPYFLQGALISGAYALATYHVLPMGPTVYPEPGAGGAGTLLYMPKDDAGMPEVNKQWLDITVKGRSLSASHTCTPYYRADESATWVAGTVVNTSAPVTTAFSSVTGRALQTYFALSSSQAAEIPEVNQVEIRFRERPTLKRSYQITLQVEDDQGDGIAAPDVQLTNLLALQAGAPVVLVDPASREKTVMVSEVSVAELVQENLEHPVLLVQLQATET